MLGVIWIIWWPPKDSQCLQSTVQSGCASRCLGHFGCIPVVNFTGIFFFIISGYFTDPVPVNPEAIILTEVFQLKKTSLRASSQPTPGHLHYGWGIVWRESPDMINIQCVCLKEKDYWVCSPGQEGHHSLWKPPVRNKQDVFKLLLTPCVHQSLAMKRSYIKINQQPGLVYIAWINHHQEWSISP